MLYEYDHSDTDEPSCLFEKLTSKMHKINLTQIIRPDLKTELVPILVAACARHNGH